MSGASGIGSDIMSGLGILGGGVATLMGAPQVGLPMMLGSGGSLLGGLGGGPATNSALFAPPFSSAPPASMGGIGGPAAYANYGTSGTGTPMPIAGMVGSPAAMGSPPPVLANPAGGAGAAAPMSGNLTPAGGLAGLQASLNTPSALAGAPNLAGAGGQPSNTALALQDAGGVGQAYQQYLMQNQLLKYRPEYVGGHSSPVGSPQYNPLAPVQSSPINPPQLTV